MTYMLIIVVQLLLWSGQELFECGVVKNGESTSAIWSMWVFSPTSKTKRIEVPLGIISIDEAPKKPMCLEYKYLPIPRLSVPIGNGLQ